MNHYYLKPKIAEYRPFVQNRFSKKEQESTEYSIVRFLKICDIFPNFVNKLATALTIKYVKQNGKIELVEMFDSDHYIFDNRIKNKDSIYYKTLKFIYNLINFKDIIYLYTDSIDNYLKELINFGETEKNNLLLSTLMNEINVEIAESITIKNTPTLHNKDE